MRLNCLIVLRYSTHLKNKSRPAYITVPFLLAQQLFKVTYNYTRSTQEGRENLLRRLLPGLYLFLGDLWFPVGAEDHIGTVDSLLITELGLNSLPCLVYW